MELDDLKNDWEEVTNQPSKKKLLTSKFIMQITQKKYASKINKIKYPELIGGIICVFGLSFIGINYNKLDTLFLQLVGVLAILLLIIMPIFSYLSLRRFNSKINFEKSYIETIKQFASQKLRFLKYQKINALMNYLLLVCTIILIPKFFYHKDLTFDKAFWIFAFTIGYIFLMFFSKWVNKFYNSSLRQAEELLKEGEA